MDIGVRNTRLVPGACADAQPLPASCANVGPRGARLERMGLVPASRQDQSSSAAVQDDAGQVADGWRRWPVIAQEVEYLRQGRRRPRPGCRTSQVARRCGHQRHPWAESTTSMRSGSTEKAKVEYIPHGTPCPTTLPATSTTAVSNGVRSAVGTCVLLRDPLDEVEEVGRHAESQPGSRQENGPPRARARSRRMFSSVTARRRGRATMRSIRSVV